MGEPKIEICNECGESVAFGDGRFFNRVPDLNSVETRREMQKLYPEGDYVCDKCDKHTESSDLIELSSLTMDELDIIRFGLNNIACGDASFCEDISTGDYENCTKCSHLRDKLNRIRLIVHASEVDNNDKG